VIRATILTSATKQSSSSPTDPISYTVSIDEVFKGVQTLTKVVTSDDIDDYSFIDGRNNRHSIKMYTNPHSAACGVTSLKRGDEYLLGKVY
jgi:hypothetical protein